MAKAKNDNFKSKKKKSNNKKQNVKVKMKKDNSKMYLMIGITLIVIAAVISVITFSFENTKVTCKKEESKNGVTINSHVTVSKKKDKIENIEVIKTISLKGDNRDNYLDAIKTSLEESYEKDGITYEISKENEKLVLKLKYTDKKKYILDNLFIDNTSDGISINLLSEDREDNYATFDLSKRYNDKNIIKILQKADYVCEK